MLWFFDRKCFGLQEYKHPIKAAIIRILFFIEKGCKRNFIKVFKGKNNEIKRIFSYKFRVLIINACLPLKVHPFDYAQLL